uniref:OCEL domain-containing protein n=1 Tax=Ananas comosus var. bracteatus TaxID=296719 RepID=A0A6V7Q4J3_ANACO|nr:unnamed protein product [Ananas comosus var. bracteatus]
MYKLGRGGGGAAAAGRGGGKRPLPPPPHLGRGGARAPMRGAAAAAASRGRPGGPGGAAAAASRDETFGLARGDPSSVSVYISRILRFYGSSCALPAKLIFSNKAMHYDMLYLVINVGGKEFKFTWSKELGDLCDIYEERRSGEDGDGLLVECGSAWRKLNVQRILDESTKNHVKMRSEEAERQSKSRKAIVLDPANPSVKSQAKSMAAAAVEAPTVAPPKSITKTGLLSNNVVKGVPLVSPVPSPPEQSRLAVSASPAGISTAFRGNLNYEEITPANVNKEETSNFEKETPSRAAIGVKNRISGHSEGIGDKPTDLQNLLITRLSENPKGMSLKALEKAVGESIPSSAKKIESLLKNIASLQVAGKYFLNPGVEVESSKRHISDSGSSPENAPLHTLVAESVTVDKDVIEKIDEKAHSDLNVEEESSPFEKIDIVGSPETVVGDQKVNNDSDERAYSSSESGSDSDSESDSSGSGSDSSRSRSKSRSPAGSASASSSDSESDGSSSSKEGSDVVVDITDDEKEVEHKTKEADLNLSPSPGEWKATEDQNEKSILGTNQEKRVASPLFNLNEFEKDDDAIHATSVTENLSHGVNSKDHQTLGIKHSMNNQSNRILKQSFPHTAVKDKPIHELSNINERSLKSKSKRSLGSESFLEKPETAKKPRAANLAQVMPPGKTMDASVLDNVHYLSPDGPVQDRPKKQINNAEWDGRTSVNADQSTQRFEQINARKKVTDKMQRTGNNVENLGRGNTHEGVSVRSDELDSFTTKNRSTQDKPSVPNEKMRKFGKIVNTDTNDKYLTKNARDSDNHLIISDSYDRNSTELSGIIRDNGQPSRKNKLDFEKSPANGKGRMLQRELSDLELGEFREPLVVESSAKNKGQYEKKGSFKSLENKVSAVDITSSDISKGRIAPNELNEQKELSPLLKDITRPPKKAMLSQNQQFSRIDHSAFESVTHLDKLAEVANKNDSREIRGVNLDYAGSDKKSPVARFPQHDNKHDGQMGNKKVMESKMQKSNALGMSVERSKNSFAVESDVNGRKRMDCSSDEDSFFYLKYDKDEPELKGPIKDFLQYKGYVQEYNEKYVAYCSLNKQLEKTRNDFLNIGRELELAKERDMAEYFSIVDKLRDMYRQSEARHKQMKKVFILLHEELKSIKERIKEYAEAYAKE